MYDKNSILSVVNCASATSVPDHLLGTRAALFHVLIGQSDDNIAMANTSDDNISMANTIVPITVPARLKPTKKRFDWRNVLSEDDFVFRSG